MTVVVVDPNTGLPLHEEAEHLTDGSSRSFPIVDHVARFAGANYTSNFGFQWNKFSRTQLDTPNETSSRDRFFAETNWTPAGLQGLDVLEVGSGAGRFSRVVLEETAANLWSIDYSDAVAANFKSNGHIAPERFHLFQASVYEMPFPDACFDKVFCFGVLQHTPDFEKSVHHLVKKAKPGAEIVVDFYCINGWWTKLNAKYLLRPWTKRLDADKLLALIESNIDRLLTADHLLRKLGLGVLTRFLPLKDVSHFPPNLSARERRELAVLDTFDMYSPEYDQPQRVDEVVRMFERAGARVTFAGKVAYGGYGIATVVRAIRSAQPGA